MLPGGQVAVGVQSDTADASGTDLVGCVESREREELDLGGGVEAPTYSPQVHMRGG